MSCKILVVLTSWKQKKRFKKNMKYGGKYTNYELKNNTSFKTTRWRTNQLMYKVHTNIIWYLFIQHQMLKKTYICFLKTSDVKEGAIQDQDDWQGSALSERIMCPVINQYEHPYNLAWSEDTHCYVAGQTLTSNKLHSQQLE